MANPAIIDSYTDLRNAIEDHMNRSDIDDEGVSAMVVDLAEARLNRDVTHPNRVARDDAFTIDGQYVATPTDYWRTIRIALSNASRPIDLEYVTPEEMAEKRYQIIGSGQPIYYTVVGSNFEFLRSPDQSYTGLLVYQQAIPALASNATNWLLDDHPDIYLYACLAEAHYWAQDQQEGDVWDARYTSRLFSLNRQGQREQHGGTPRARTRSFG